MILVPVVTATPTAKDNGVAADVAINAARAALLATRPTVAANPDPADSLTVVATASRPVISFRR
jgi:hypothetical protein